MALTERLAILITANGAQAMGEFQKVGRNAERSLASVEQRSQRIGQGLTRAGAAMIGFGAVMGTGMFMAARAAEEQTRAELELANTISQIPALAGASTSAFLDQADALMQVTVADDAAIVSAQAMLGTFHMTQDEILQTTPLVVDYARKFGVDLVEAAKQVGKAMQGNRGALQRNGIMIDENAYATDRFSAVLGALRENAGGFAEAEGQTFSGQLEIMKNRLGEVAEGVGVGAVDAFTNLLGAVEGVSGALDSVGGSGQAFVGQLLTYGAVGSVAFGALSLVAGGVVRFAGAAKGAADAAYMLYLRVRTSQMTMGQMAAAAGKATAAIALVTVAIGEYYSRQSATAAATDAMAERFETTGSATEGLQRNLTEMTGAWDDWQVAASGEDISRAMHAAGLSIEDLQTALDGGEDSIRAFAEQLEATGEIGSDFRGSGFIEDINEGLAHLGENTEVSGLDRTITTLEELRSQMERGLSNNQAAEGIGATGDAADRAAEAVDELSQALTDYFDATFGVESAQDAVIESSERLLASLVENGPSIEGTGQAARDNRAAFEEWATDIGTATERINEFGGGAQVAAGYIEQQRASLARARDMGLISTATFQRYDDVLRGLLGEVTTTVLTPGLPGGTSLMRELRSIADNLDGRTVRMTAIADVVGLDAMRELRSTAGQWSGGAVPGGSGEPVNALLHGGEYVLSEDVVDRIRRGRPSRGADVPGGGTASGGGGTNITVNVSGVVGNGDEVARHVMAEIRKLEKAVAA